MSGNNMAANWWDHLGLATRGAWGHLAVAAMLITGLPALILVWLCIGSVCRGGCSPLALTLASAAWIVFSSLGYAILTKYPLSIVRLRSYLHSLAHSQLPDDVTLPPTEDDLTAIQEDLKHVVGMAAERLRLLREKHAADLAAERHRIMVESIASLCHHVGQPASVLGMQLYFMKCAAEEPAAAAMVVECEKAFGDIMNTLDRLRQLTHYETDLYLTSDPHGGQIIRLPEECRTPVPDGAAGEHFRDCS